MSTHTQNTLDDGVEPVLDGEADFAALKAHFEPKLQICIGLALKGLDTCFESLFVNWENEFDAKLTSTLAALRKCTYLQCKPSERQLITKFLAHVNMQSIVVTLLVSQEPISSSKSWAATLQQNPLVTHEDPSGYA